MWQQQQQQQQQQQKQQQNRVQKRVMWVYRLFTISGLIPARFVEIARQQLRPLKGSCCCRSVAAGVCVRKFGMLSNSWHMIGKATSGQHGAA